MKQIESNGWHVTHVVILKEVGTEGIAHLNEVAKRLCDAKNIASSKPCDAKPGKHS